MIKLEFLPSNLIIDEFESLILTWMKQDTLYKYESLNH